MRRATRGIKRGRPLSPRSEEILRAIKENPGLSAYKIGLIYGLPQSTVWDYKRRLET